MWPNLVHWSWSGDASSSFSFVADPVTTERWDRRMAERREKGTQRGAAGQKYGFTHVYTRFVEDGVYEDARTQFYYGCTFYLT